METDSSVLIVNTKDIIENLKILEDFFDLINLNETHEKFSKKKVIGKFKIETPENIWINEFIALRSKCYAFRCGDDRKNKFKGISQTHSKNIFLMNIKNV